MNTVTNKNGFDQFARGVVAECDGHLMEDGPQDQVARAVAALERFDAHTPLRPHTEGLNLFGFARTVTVLASDNDTYFRLLPVARQLGMTEGAADRWARQEYLWALEDQRREDEERGQLGWDCLRSWINLDLYLIFEDETAAPDANGRRWSDTSEWLIARGRVMSLLLASPWSEEFMANAIPLMSFAMKASGLADEFAEVKTYTTRKGDGGRQEMVPTGKTLADAFAADRHGITEEEAVRRALRGPHLA